MKKIILVLLALSPIVSLAQTVSKNLEKYWFYRERLRNNFVVISPNNEPGTNIPASCINLANNLTNWDDGNGALSQYIGVLATEYRLLKNYGQNCETTARELYYALRVLERLDLNAESFFGATPSLDGFFIRWDINEQFWTKYKKGGASEFFPTSRIPNEKIVKPGCANIEPSQDNIIHHLEGLALVNALVDKETIDGKQIDFKQIAKDISERIVGLAYHEHTPKLNKIDIGNAAEDLLDGIDFITPDFLLPKLTNINEVLPLYWYVNNRVTGELVSEGNGADDWTGYVHAYGLRKAAEQILGLDKFSKTTELNRVLFKKSLDCTDALDLNLRLWAKLRICVASSPISYGVTLELGGASLWGTSISGNGILCKPIKSFSNTKHLASIPFIGDSYKLRSLVATGNISTYGDEPPYDYLIHKRNSATKFHYEHLPLLWGTLHPNDVHPTDNDRDFINNLLNLAPQKGPYNYGNGNNGGKWASTSRLIWPEDLPENNGDKPLGEGLTGDFNGLDYMLLHNLHWLVNLKTSTPLIDFTINYPITLSSNTPLIIETKRHIEASNTISIIDGYAILVAGESITLKPGFHATALSGSFSAKISDNSGSYLNPNIYKQMPLNNYPYPIKLGTASPIRYNNDIINNESDPDIIIHPNPSNGIITIETSVNPISIHIFNTTGEEIVLLENINKNINTIEIPASIPGIYFVRITTNTKITTNKIVIQ